MSPPSGWSGPWHGTPRRFFARDPLVVAPELLGLVLARLGDDGSMRAGRIVEVEAYRGVDDPASHAFRGPTPRTRVMFGPPGHLYVYRSYGLHWCANVVCSPNGVAGAVLIRGLEPCVGIEAMRLDRPAARRDPDLANGPGKVCAALGIDGDDGGTDVSRDGTRVVVVRAFAELVSPTEVERGPRVGISRAVDVPWRFWLAGTPRRSPQTRQKRGPS